MSLDIETLSLSRSYTDKKISESGGGSGSDSAILKDGTTTTTAIIPFDKGIKTSSIYKKDGTQEIEFDSQLNVNNNKIVNILDPSNDFDGANKKYVDSEILKERTAARIRDLFGLKPGATNVYELPIISDNVLVVFYTVTPDGTANVQNAKAFNVANGSSKTKDTLTATFNENGTTLTFVSSETENAILGQYYGYNN